MDSRSDSSDHVTSFHSKEGNLHPQKFSFFTIILQIFKLLLVIFGISIGDEEDAACTSEFMLHKDEDLTGRISDTTEHDNTVVSNIQSEIDPLSLDTPEEINVEDFESGDEASEIKDIFQSNFISPAEEDPPKAFTEEFEISSQTSQIEDFIQSNSISPADKDSPKKCRPDFENGVQTSEIKQLNLPAFVFSTSGDLIGAFTPDFQPLEMKDAIHSSFNSLAEEDSPKRCRQDFENDIQTSEIKQLNLPPIVFSTSEEPPNDNSLDSKNFFERQDIEELIECILTAGSTNDCTEEFQNVVETSKGENLTLSNAISSTEEGKTYNTGFASCTSKTVSKDIKEVPLSIPAVEDSIKISNESPIDTCLASALKINKDCKDQKIKSTTTTDAVGSLNDLGKNSRDVRKTKGSLPNIPSEKSENTWAYYVDKEERNIAGVGPFMCQLFEKQLFTDVTFYFNETKSFFSAHRVVLAARCDYFEKLLFGKLMNEAVDMEMHVDIKDVPLPIFTKIVKYLYTDTVKLVDDCDVLDTYRAVKMYGIHPLMKACKAYIHTMDLTENNACSMLELSHSKDIYELKTRCISYIRKNTSQVIRSKDFQRCCYRTVREICAQDVLNLKSEGELLEAVLCWTDLQKTSKQCKDDYRRGLLKRVRFLRFTPREFSEVLQKQPNLLTTKEGLKILMALNNPSSDSFNNLPKWCNKQTYRRTIQAEQKSIPKSVVGEDDRRWVSITLKPLEKRLQSGPLTCLLHLQCLDGVRHITRVTFSLGNVAAEGCAFDISVAVTPDGTSFHMTHSTRSKESVLTFEKPISVQAGQTFQMEARAESHQRCQFLQFDKWHSDHLDFMCYFISKPMANRLYFISAIEYEPV